MRISYWSSDVCSSDLLASADPEIAAAIGGELKRQQDKIELIASENIASKAVLEATGSVFTNKYAEGYQGKRYYGGCHYADIVEKLARERVKALRSEKSRVGKGCVSTCRFRW